MTKLSMLFLDTGDAVSPELLARVQKIVASPTIMDDVLYLAPLLALLLLAAALFWLSERITR